ncbi:flagellar hook-length control protein FliK [Citreimonas sp.]|uniref:flagellar hook-length control protein FliK n=1 Tax=Citreimonas sp. TaxID=3036715 RepID=UPI0040589D61
MLAKIGNFFGLTDAGHVPSRQSGARPEQDFGAFVAAARMSSQEKDGAPGPGAVDVAQTDEADVVADADVALETEGDPDVAAGAEAGEDLTLVVDPAAATTDPEEANLSIAGAIDAPEGEAADQALGGASSAPAESGAEDVASEIGLARHARAAPEGPAVGRDHDAAVPRAVAEAVSARNAARGVEAAGIGARVAPIARAMNDTMPTGAAATSAAAMPSGTAATPTMQAEVINAQAGETAVATSAEFALHRASLQAEKLAQLMTGADAARAEGRGAAGAVPQPTLTGAGADPAAISKKVESLIKLAETAAEPDVKAPDAATAAARTIAGAAQAISQPVGAFASAVAPQAVIAAGVTHPSILDAGDEGDAPEFGSLGGTTELRTGGAQPTVFAAPSRTDAAAVVRQISDAMPRAGNGTIEIRLSPEELGHVRLQMVPGESGMIVHIQAERSETLDLLRRHVDQLARDLAESGHDASGFTFAEGRDGDASGGNASGDGPAGRAVPGAPVTPATAEAEPETNANVRADGGLDMKI